MKVWIAALALALLLAGGTAAPGSASPSSRPAPRTPATALAPTPVVQGNRLVDSRTGATWLPRGVDWPDLEYSCVQGWDAAPRHSLEETRAMAVWGINVVRIPLNQDCWLGADGAPTGRLTAAGYRAEVAQRVSLAHQAHLAVILDLHWSAPAGIRATEQYPMPDQTSVTFWSSVAQTFRNDRSVMFDLVNEPFSPDYVWPGNPAATAVDWSCWTAGCAVSATDQAHAPTAGTPTYAAVGMAALVGAVRNAGARQPLILSGLAFANDLSGWLASRPADGQLVAGWHAYAFNECRQACWQSTVVQVAAQVPVMMTETGYSAADPAWLDSALTFAESRGIGYLAWAWWSLHATELGQDAGNGTTKNDYALLEPGTYAPHGPAGTILHAHLGSRPFPITGTVPRIKGTPRVGRRLRVLPGAWTPGVTLRVQWLRNGKPIRKATKRTYRLAGKDRRARIRVRITATRAGWATRVLASRAVKAR